MRRHSHGDGGSQESEEKKKKMPRGKRKRIGHMIMVKTGRVDEWIMDSSVHLSQSNF
jgi:hypothetical protein